MAKSKIEWTDYTFNPWIGCTKVSEGCKNCYAERDNKRYQWNKNGWGKGVPRHRTSEANWGKVLAWNIEAAKQNTRFKVFCGSLCDIFDTEVDITWLMDLLNLIRITDHLDWLLLTKRIEEVDSRISEATGFSDSGMWLYTWDHVWLGVSVENQEMANKRIPELLKIPARIKFLSCEPLLEVIDLIHVHDEYEHTYYDILNGRRFDYGIRDFGVASPMPKSNCIDWVIVGGESGPKKRQFNSNWARIIKEQCNKSNVPFFMKQIDKKQPIPEDLLIREFPE